MEKAAGEAAGGSIEEEYAEGRRALKISGESEKTDKPKTEKSEAVEDKEH